MAISLSGITFIGRTSAGKQTSPFWIATLAEANDAAEGIATDASGNMYVTGYTFTGGINQMFLLKLDSGANILWQRAVSNGAGLFGKDIAVASSGNVYVAVSANGAGGMPDFVITKYSSSGTLTWIRRLYSNSAFDNVRGITTDSSENVYVAGSSDASGDSQFFIAKYDSSGTLQWQRRFGTACSGFDVDVDSSGNIYVAGQITGTGPAQANMLLVKYDSAGDPVWQRILGSGYTEECRSVTVDSANNICITGQTYSPGTDSPKIVTAKYDSSGTLLWQEGLDGALTEYGSSISTDSSNNVYVSGVANNAVAIVKYNSSGVLQWQRKLSSTGTENAPAVAIDSTGNVCIATGTYVSSPVQALVAKLPPDGTLTGTYGAFTYATTTYTAAATTLSDSTPSLSSAAGALTADTPSYTEPTAAFVATVINM
jgi:uncharacterized delta-60 repeat protein